MELTRDVVEKVALLGRLALTDEEIVKMSGQLGAILEYVEQLNEVDTANVEPLAHCLPLDNVFREDVLTPSLPVNEALANAPKRVEDFYSAPAILD